MSCEERKWAGPRNEYHFQGRGISLFSVDWSRKEASKLMKLEEGQCDLSIEHRISGLSWGCGQMMLIEAVARWYRSLDHIKEFGLYPQGQMKPLNELCGGVSNIERAANWKSAELGSNAGCDNNLLCDLSKWKETLGLNHFIYPCLYLYLYPFAYSYLYLFARLLCL